MSELDNQQLVLISGESGSGKSASLMNIRNQDRWIYHNCESGKRLPFRNNFRSVTITDPIEVYDYFDQTLPGAEYHGMVDGHIIDTVTFLMDMVESQWVLGAADTQKAWGDYAQYFKKLMLEKVAASDKSVIVLGHNKEIYDEKTLSLRTRLAIKGSIGNDRGAEAFFSTVVSTKKIELKNLGKFDDNLLHITPEDEALGYKHVFQTRLTKETVGERIRSPMGMFTPEQTYIDNDAQLLLDHLNAYYNSVPSAA